MIRLLMSSLIIVCGWWSIPIAAEEQTEQAAPDAAEAPAAAEPEGSAERPG
jgi:hypothetical protein